MMTETIYRRAANRLSDRKDGLTESQRYAEYKLAVIASKWASEGKQLIGDTTKIIKAIFK